MLHLLPIRRLMTAIIALAGIAVLAAVYEGLIGKGDTLSDVRLIVNWSFTAAMVLAVGSYAAWRWLPVIQNLTFPYLGGCWTGQLQFVGKNGEGTRDISLYIKHTLLGISLILDSAESTSRTLVVHAERDIGIDRDRLYYVYLNERKEGVPGSGERYRGLAILRAETKNHPTLYGDYFTEQQSSGKLRLHRQHPHPWWALWK